jgi:hypothetical protein
MMVHRQLLISFDFVNNIVARKDLLGAAATDLPWTRGQETFPRVTRHHANLTGPLLLDPNELL